MEAPNLALLSRAVRSPELQARVQMACALLGVPFTEAEVILVVSRNIADVTLAEGDNGLAADTTTIQDTGIWDAIQSTMTDFSEPEPEE